MTLRSRIAIAGLTALLAAPASAVTYNGRLTSAFYSWKSREIDGTSATHARIYQSVIANVRRIGGNALSFHSYAQVAGDAGDTASGQADYRIYHAYLDWRQTGGIGFNVTAGRQRVFGAVGFGTIDGLQVQAQPTPTLRLKAFGGILVPLVPDDGLGTWDEGHLLGAQALLDVGPSTFGLSFAQRAREPIPYAAPGRYSGVVPEIDAKQFSRLGVDARTDLDRLSLYGRVDLDLETADEQIRMQELELVATAEATERITVTGEFHQREPTIYLNSILSVFEVSSDREVAGRLSFKMSELVRLSSSAAHVDYDGDSSWRLGFGMLVGNGYFGYSRRLGYGGENDAYTASYQQPINEKLTVKMDGSIAGYRLYEEQSERDQAIAGSLGLRYRAKRNLWIEVEGQGVRNKYYTNDFRLFVRGSWWFFKRGGS